MNERELTRYCTRSFRQVKAKCKPMQTKFPQRLPNYKTKSLPIISRQSYNTRTDKWMETRG